MRHGNRHWADTAGDRCDVGGFGCDRLEFDIADGSRAFAGIFDAVDADVDDGDTVFDHVCAYEIWAADCGDQYVCLAGDLSEVAGAQWQTVTVALPGQAFCIMSSAAGLPTVGCEDHDVLALGLDLAALDELDDAGRGAGHEAAEVFLAELTDVDGVEAIDVFFGATRLKVSVSSMCLSAVRCTSMPLTGSSLRASIWAKSASLLTSSARMWLLPMPMRSAVFCFCVRYRGRVFAHTHNGNDRLRARQGADFLGQFFDDGFCDSVAVDELH